jgi:hypothetical protein
VLVPVTRMAAAWGLVALLVRQRLSKESAGWKLVAGWRTPLRNRLSNQQVRPRFASDINGMVRRRFVVVGG